MTRQTRQKVFAYLRVSDISQTKGDGFARQEKACREYASSNNLQIVHIYREDISGTEEYRPVLAQIMVAMEKNHSDIKSVLIEKLDRLARDLMLQEKIVQDFQNKGFNIISSMEGHDLCSNDPTRKLIRQFFGAIAEYDKVMLVAKLRASRERVKAKYGKCEGRKRYDESEDGRKLVAYIKYLHRKPKNGFRRTYQQIADILNENEIRTLNGKTWTLNRVHRIINQ